MSLYAMSPARWTILQALADAPAPLDRKQLATLTNTTASVVYHNLLRPVAEGWVSITGTTTEHRNIMKNLYGITDTGRTALAEHLQEDTNA